MTPQLEVVWSGAKERNGEAVGLSSPLIGSAARLCIELGNHRTEDGTKQPKYTRKRQMACQRCSRKFDRVGMERLCSRCFVGTYRPIWS